MIIEIKVANYRSINEEQTLSFVADRATRHPDNLIKRPGYRLLKAVGLFGANASGKSNFLKAIAAMSTFVRDSATKMNDGDPILAAEPYRLEPASRDKPSRFEITFLTDGTVYTYGFAADSQRVHEERLTAKREAGETKLFNVSREPHHSSILGMWKADGFNTSITHLLTQRTRSNALFLSTAARENVEELLPVYRYLRDEVSVHDLSGAMDRLYNDSVTSFADDAIMRKQVISLLCDADTGIRNIALKLSLPQALPEIKPDDPSTVTAFTQVVDRFLNSIGPGSIFTTRRDAVGNDVEFNFEKDESRGTNRLFAVTVFLLDALRTGAFVVVDEIDASMHPLLTRRLLEMFQSPEANPNGAQLLFTTHDPSLLDQVLFRRDQIWLAEKCQNASTFFSLADIQPSIRSTESFLRNYLAGRYGGTPYLGRAFSLVETPVNK